MYFFLFIIFALFFLISYFIIETIVLKEEETSFVFCNRSFFCQFTLEKDVLGWNWNLMLRNFSKDFFFIILFKNREILHRNLFIKVCSNI